MHEAVLNGRDLFQLFYQPLEPTSGELKRSVAGKGYIYDRIGGSVRHLPNYHQGFHLLETALR